MNEKLFAKFSKLKISELKQLRLLLGISLIISMLGVIITNLYISENVSLTETYPFVGYFSYFCFVIFFLINTYLFFFVEKVLLKTKK